MYQHCPKHFTYVVLTSLMKAGKYYTIPQGWGVGGALICRVYQFLWCKYSHPGGCQATNVISLSVEAERWVLLALHSPTVSSSTLLVLTSHVLETDRWDLKKDLEVNLHNIHIFQYEKLGPHVDYWHTHDYISN